MTDFRLSCHSLGKSMALLFVTMPVLSLGQGQALAMVWVSIATILQPSIT